MSLRTGRPNTASASSISPTVSFSRLVTADFIVLFPVFRRRRARDPCRLNRSREGSILRRRTLLGVAEQHVTAIAAWHRALHHDQAAVGIDRDDLQILGCHPFGAKMTSHLLARKGPARILAIAGRAMRAMRYRNAMRCAQAPEIVPLHHAGESLADAGPRHIDELTRH